MRLAQYFRREDFLKFHLPYLFLAWRPFYSEVGVIGHNYNKSNFNQTWWDGPWVVVFHNCVRQLRPLNWYPTAAKFTYITCYFNGWTRLFQFTIQTVNRGTKMHKKYINKPIFDGILQEFQTVFSVTAQINLHDVRPNSIWGNESDLKLNWSQWCIKCRSSLDVMLIDSLKWHLHNNVMYMTQSEETSQTNKILSIVNDSWIWVKVTQLKWDGYRFLKIKLHASGPAIVLWAST